jgi:hypothetical protein
MIIDDLNVMSVALAKLEANAPALIHGHCPLIFTFTPELVQANAFEWAEVAEFLCNIYASSRSMAASKSSPPNWFGRSPSQTFLVAELRHDRIMA